jgi:hypothetical protein
MSCYGLICCWGFDNACYFQMKVLSLEYLEFSFILRPVSKWKKTFNIGTHKFNRIKTIAGYVKLQKWIFYRLLSLT